MQKQTHRELNTDTDTQRRHLVHNKLMCPIRQWSPVLLHQRDKTEAKQLLLSFLLCCINRDEQLCEINQ